MATQYTDRQIAAAKARYIAFMQYRSVESFEPEFIGIHAAEQRSESHNRMVDQVRAGNQEVIRDWKLFFLNDEAANDRKAQASKDKKAANKANSADVLAPVKAAKRLVEFGKWLNTAGNPYRSQHFSKKYTAEAVSSFINS